MSKHIISVAFALLVVLVTAAIVGAQLMIVPETASIDDPIAIAIEPAWVNHSTLRIDEGGAFYRANVDQETMLFTARRPGTHRVTLVDTETGATLEEASILVTASEKPVEIPTVEPAPIDIPVEEPQAVVNESSPEIIIEPIVETVIEAPQSVVAPTPPRVRPTVPLLTWDRAPGRGVPDGLARARAQTSLPNITVDDIRRDARGRYDMRLRAAGYNALEIRGADALPTNNGVEFMAPMGTSTDIVLVEGVQIENATVRLAKDSQVDAIARCDGFLPDGTCSGWTTTDIAFTDFGSYVEFTVPHFSGYAGVNNATYFFVENTTLMPTATANRVHVNLTFSDPSGSQWLIIAASEYIMNITTIEGRVYLTRDYATIVAMMAKRVTETPEVNTFFYITNYSGDGGTVTFLINASSGAVGGNLTVRRSRIMALRLDGPSAAQYNGTYDGALTSNVDTVYGDDAGDAVNVSLDVRDPGLYLIYGGASYGSDATTTSSRMRLVMNGTVIKPSDFIEEEDAATSETHIGSLMHVENLSTGFHTFALQYAGESGATADWQYKSVGAVRLSDVYTFWYASSSGTVTTTSTATPANALVSVNDTYTSHNYTVIANGLINASATARRTESRTYVNNVIEGNASIRPRDLTDKVAMGALDHFTGATTLTVNMTVISSNAANIAAMRSPDILIIEVGNYTEPTFINNAFANVTGPTRNGTVIRVNASITNISPTMSVTLQVDSPSNNPYNITMMQNGTEWVNRTLLLNETGIWSFVIIANDTPGFVQRANVTDLQGTPYIEVNSTPTITTVNITPATAYAYNELIGYCNATAGADRPLSYDATWFINGTRVLNVSSPLVSITVNDNHACALVAKDRRVVCWGYNANGQIGNGNTGTNVNVSTLTSDTSAYLLASAGGLHTCGIRANDSRVLCWGSNGNGRLGNDDPGVASNVPILTSDTSAYISVSAGGEHTCGIRANDSRVLCWGRNNNGQQGNAGLGVSNTVPNLTSDTSAYRMIGTGSAYTCGIRANDSRVLCWGNNGYGQLGNNDTGTNLDIPTLTNDTSAYATLSVGPLTVCGIRANDSRVLCWGYNNEGQIGNNESAVDRNIPTLTNDTSAYRAISVGSTVCGIRMNDSRVLCWGYNNEGQLGINTTGAERNIPTLTNDTASYRMVAAGTAAVCGVRVSDNRVLCWGYNGQGQLGMNNSLDYNIPRLTNDTRPVHGGSASGEAHAATILNVGYYAGYNVTLQCRAYDGNIWSDAVNASKIIQDAGPPTISNVSAISAITLLVSQNVTVRINFTVYEPDGVEGLIDASANFTLRNNSFSRTGSCSSTDLNTTSVRYNCSLSLTHFDTAGTWIVNVSIRDRGQNNVSNASMTATINSLLAINVTATSLSFGTLAPGTGPTAAAVPIIIDNDGNVNISWLNITTYTLINGTGSIGVGNITVNSTPNVGTRFTNATPLNLTNSSVPLDTAIAPGNRSLYFYITVPNGTPSYAYTPIQAWEVTTT